MRKNKTYSIESGPFYKLRSKKKLLKILSLKRYAELKELEKNGRQYCRQFTKKTNGGKERKLTKFFGPMKVVHKKLSELLARIETPSYLMSKRGCSALKNAKIHLDSSEYVFTTDINNFFPLCIRERIAYSFKEHFKMSGDIAYLLSNILTVEGRIPQGGNASSLISFWSNYSMFNEINDLCHKKVYKFSLYVDDLTVSSKTKIDQIDIDKIIGILKKNGFKVKPQKTKYFKKDQAKHIMGVVILKKKILLESAKKKKFFSLLNSKETNKASLSGLYYYCKTIEPDFAPTLEKHFYGKAIPTGGKK